MHQSCKAEIKLLKQRIDVVENSNLENFKTELSYFYKKLKQSDTVMIQQQNMITDLQNIIILLENKIDSLTETRANECSRVCWTESVTVEKYSTRTNEIMKEGVTGEGTDEESVLNYSKNAASSVVSVNSSKQMMEDDSDTGKILFEAFSDAERNMIINQQNRIIMIENKLQTLSETQVDRMKMEEVTVEVFDKEYVNDEYKDEASTVLVNSSKPMKEENKNKIENHKSQENEEILTTPHSTEEQKTDLKKLGNDQHIGSTEYKKIPKKIGCNFCLRKFRVVSGLLKHLSQVHHQQYHEHPYKGNYAKQGCVNIECQNCHEQYYCGKPNDHRAY